MRTKGKKSVYGKGFTAPKVFKQEQAEILALAVSAAFLIKLKKKYGY